MTTRRSLATIAAVLLILIAGVGVLYAVRSQTPTAVVSSAPSVSPAASPSSSPRPSASPAPPPGTFENRILGYRITLPIAYRLAGTSINARQPEELGTERFTVTTVAEAQADCLSETGGGIGSAIKGEPVDVSVIANVRGLSVLPWTAGSA